MNKEHLEQLLQADPALVSKLDNLRFGAGELEIYHLDGFDAEYQTLLKCARAIDAGQSVKPYLSAERVFREAWYLRGREEHVDRIREACALLGVDDLEAFNKAVDTLEALDAERGVAA